MAEDILRNVFLAAYRHLGRIRDPKAWLAKATLNASRAILRGSARHHAAELPDDLPDPDADPSAKFEEQDDEARRPSGPAPLLRVPGT